MSEIRALAFAVTLIAWTVSASRTEAAESFGATTAGALSTHKFHLVGRHKWYSVDVAYPRFSGYPANVADALNQAVRHTVNQNIPAQPGTKQWTNAFSCTYHICLVSPRVVSVDFEFYDYLGGAHGLTRHVPFNYQMLPTVQPVTLRSALGKRVCYRDLSDLCWTKLKPKLPVDFSNNRPFDKRMLSAFTIGKQGLTFTFPESTITAYAFGCPTATISYRELSPMLSRRSILQNL